MTFYGQVKYRCTDADRVWPLGGRLNNQNAPSQREQKLAIAREIKFLLRLAKRMANDRKCQTREYREKMSFAARMAK